jgi:periplasmic protein TonB
LPPQRTILETSMKHIPGPRPMAPAALAAVVAVLLAACSSTPPGPAPVDVVTPVPVQTQPSAAASAQPAAPAQAAAAVRSSGATSARAYRTDAASHLYGMNQDRIYKGRMPPMLYAVGVLQVEVDGRGNVRHLNWMRAPRHAPEVIAEIERTVRAAAPFPAPARMGKVVYTDTWLWDKSGRFQLDTLTEGQD